MSISVLYHTQGILGHIYQRTDYIGGACIFHIQSKQELIRCPVCKSKDIQHRGVVERKIMLLPTGSKTQFASVTIPRVFCHKCNILRQVDIRFAEPNKRYSKAFERYVIELCSLMSIEAVSRHLAISWHTVKDIHKTNLHKKFAKPKLKKLRHIAIDEIFIGKKQKYITLVLDQESGAVVFVGDGKGSDALKPFWKRLGKFKKLIESVAIDMSPAFTRAVRENLPRAILVYDRFHVMKLYNEKLSLIRRWLYRESSKDGKKFLQGTRWILLKNQENLTEEEAGRLEELLRVNEPLSVAYFLKEQLQLVWEQEDDESAHRVLEKWKELAEESGIRLLQKMSKTLSRHEEGILNYYKFRVTTAKLEGTNGKIRVMQRMGYGYRDKEYLKLKILGLHEDKLKLSV